MSFNNSDVIPYGRQQITEDDISAVVKVLRSPFLTQGPIVPKFEQAVSLKVGAQFGVAVNNATSALHIACLSLGLGPNDRIWTSPITFVASANCGRYCGAQVDFVDIEPDTGLMSITALKVKLQKAEQLGALPKIVVPVHLGGASCDMKALDQLAHRYQFYVVEDASHAIGGKYRNEPVGSCTYSNICIFSFHPVKIITTGEGGLATTNDPELARRMTDLRSHGIIKDATRFERPAAGQWSYEQQVLGYNYRLSDIHAALGLSQLQRLDEIMVERHHLHDQYRKLMTDLPLKLLRIPQGVYSSLHLAVIRLEDPCPELHRVIFDGLRSAGIGVQLHYSPVHLQPIYRRLGFNENDYPQAESYAKNAISLPIYPGLQKTDLERIANTLTHLIAK